MLLAVLAWHSHDVRALKTISVLVPEYFPAEVAQRYLDEISRDLPPRLLLLGVKFAVELAKLEGGIALRKLGLARRWASHSGRVGKVLAIDQPGSGWAGSGLFTKVRAALP